MKNLLEIKVKCNSTWGGVLSLVSNIFLLNNLKKVYYSAQNN